MESNLPERSFDPRGRALSMTGLNWSARRTPLGPASTCSDVAVCQSQGVAAESWTNSEESIFGWGMFIWKLRPLKRP